MASLRRSRRSRAATKLKSFAFSSRASRPRGESPAQDSPRSREERQEREDFAKKNPFLPQRIFGLVLRRKSLFFPSSCFLLSALSLRPAFHKIELIIVFV